MHGLPCRHMLNPTRPLAVFHICMFTKLHNKCSARRQRRFVKNPFFHISFGSQPSAVVGAVSRYPNALTDIKEERTKSLESS